MSLAPFYTPLKKETENQRFSHFFRGYRKKPVVLNGLVKVWGREYINKQGTLKIY